MRKIAVCLALLLTLLAPALQGAIVQFAGVINNDAGGQISQWRTAGTPKTLDADGDNLYGTTARLFYTLTFVGEGSLYQFNSSDDQVGPFAGYAVVDHPTGGADTQVRTTTNNGAAGPNDVMFTFTALAGSPANVRIGIATDGLDGAQYSPASIGLRQVGGGGSSAEHTLTAVNNTLDMVFFDVTGVQAGDQFEVFGDTGTGGYATHQFVTWDVVIPPFVVTTAADELDPVGTLGAGVSLREALRDAPDGAGIVFDNTLSGATLTLDSEIVLGKNVTIDASNITGGLTVDGDGESRIFTVNSGQSVTLRGLTLANGDAEETTEGGGAIYNNGGRLTLTHCTLSGNRAQDSFNGGGAISTNGGTLTLTRCTLSGNDAIGSSYGGGAISIVGGTGTLTHCTISANNDVGSTGGAISIHDSGTLTLNSCIVAGNYGAGMDINSSPRPGTVTGSGANLIGSNQTVEGTFPVGPLVGTEISPKNPLLAPFGNYGGPTQTMALLPGSPARNNAIASLATSDQRGFPIVGVPDIGAYEAGTLTNCPAYLAETLPASATAAQIAPGYDYDGDGATNEQEWAALTDPASAASVFRITSAVKSGANVIITFPSVTGRTYTLWQSDTLSGTWTNTNQTAITGNGTPKTFTIPAPVPGIPKRFHRVQVGP